MRRIIVGLLCLVASLTYADRGSAQNVLTVGVFDNRPIVFRDDAGAPAGLAVELLEDIAAREGWTLRFVHGAWADVLRRLEAGEIDLLTGIAYSEERSWRFDFTDETLINNWGVVERNPSARITTLLDLEGKRLALVQRSIHSKTFTQLLVKFGIGFTPVFVEDYHSVLQTVAAGDADGGVVNRVFSTLNTGKYNVAETSIVFNPVEVRYATPKGQHAAVRAAIDRHLAAQRTQPDSAYSRALQFWLKDDPHAHVAGWIKPAVAILAGALLFAALWGFVLRGQVEHRTQQLAREREALRRSEQRYAQAQRAGAIGSWEWDIDSGEVFWSETIEPMFGLEVGAFGGTYDAYREMIHEGDVETVLRSIQAALEDDADYDIEHRIAVPDGSVRWVHATGDVVRDGRGKAVKMLGVVRDITERRTAEEAARKSRDVFELLAEYTSATSSMNVDDVAGHTLQFLQEYLGVEESSIAILTEDGRGFHLKAAVNRGTKGFQRGDYVSLEDTLLSQIVTQVSPRYRPDLTTEARQYKIEQRLMEYGIRSTFHVPLYVDDRCIGVINTGSRAVDGFNEADRQLISLIGPRLAQSLQNAMLFESLRTSDAYNRMLFESSPVGLVSCTTGGRLVDVNPAFAEIIGYSVDETLALSRWDFAPVEYAEAEHELMKRVEAGEKDAYIEIEQIRKDGHRVPVRVRRSIVARDGKQLVWSAVEDISKSVAVERALAKSKAEFEAMFNSISDAILYAGTDRRLMLVNPAMTKLFGYTPQEVLGKETAMLYAEDQGFRRAGQQQYSTQAASDFSIYQMRYRHKDGHTFIGETMGAKVFDAQGEVVGFIGIVRDITERTRIARDLEESQNMLQTVLDSIPVRVFWKDRESRFLGCNAHFAHDAGYERPEDVVGKTDYELPWREQADLYRFDDRKVIETGASKLNYEEPQTWPDGTALWLETSKVPLKDADDNTMGVLGTYEDITTRKNAENAMLRLGRVLEYSSNEIYVFDAETLKFTQVNQGAQENLGYSMGELEQMTPVDIKPEFDGAQFVEMIQPLRDGSRETIRFETDHERKDGSRYRVEVRLQLSRFEEPQVFIAIIQDIAARQRVESALHALARNATVAESDRFLRESVANLCEAYGGDCAFIGRVQDPQKRIAETLVAYRGGEFIANFEYALAGTPCADVLGCERRIIPDDAQALFPDDVLLAEMGAVSYFGAPLVDSTGNALGLLVVLGKTPILPEPWTEALLDVFANRIAIELERAAADAEIKRHRDHLEDLVAARTAQLEASNKELESFSYSISHDLRAPLRGIDGFSLAVLEDYGDKLDDRAHDYLIRVRRNAQRMGEQIDDLLQLSRVTRGQLKPQTLDLSAMATDVIAELKSATDAHTFDSTVAADLQAVGDPVLIRLVLQNLLENAVKYSAGTSQSQISVGSTEEDGETVFFVRDNGVGFDMRYVDKLFGVFQRLHKVDEFEGTGVGLATVHRIVQRHGGRVWVHAEEGKGATFYFTLSSGGTLQFQDDDGDLPGAESTAVGHTARRAASS